MFGTQLPWCSKLHTPCSGLCSRTGRAIQCLEHNYRKWCSKLHTPCSGLCSRAGRAIQCLDHNYLGAPNSIPLALGCVAGQVEFFVHTISELEKKQGGDGHGKAPMEKLKMK